MNLKKLIIFSFISFIFSSNLISQNIEPGAYSFNKYLDKINNKKIAVVANQSSEINGVSLIDILISFDQGIVKIFSPEHGFRGVEDAGAIVNNGVDEKTGISIISLYGKNKKPRSEQLEGVEVVLFDLQDVGVRFYTYISTLHYVMEACAENNIPLIILDRPNPNSHYIDGPILKKEFQSFVGMHPVPIVYGMTIGEYGQMINGEGWLKNGIKCDLTIVEISNYKHSYKYSLPVKPSPNLPNDKSINLYPSLCFFEGTPISAGRGTNSQFQIFGSPDLKSLEYSFTPKPNMGSKNPKFNGVECYGRNLSCTNNLNYINLDWLIEAYSLSSDKSKFFNSFFVKLAGTQTLKKLIIEGRSSDYIRNTWEEDIENFKKVRSKYLIYLE